ncbi:hypothetical protein ACVIGB_000811 [Bradyrhizobium sp. USDA 4341]
MIDLVHNPDAGFAMLHDEERLDGARKAMVSRDGRLSVTEASGRLRILANKIPLDLLPELRKAAAVPFIRVQGMHAVNVGTISIFIAV